MKVAKGQSCHFEASLQTELPVHVISLQSSLTLFSFFMKRSPLGLQHLMFQLLAYKCDKPQQIARIDHQQIQMTEAGPAPVVVRTVFSGSHSVGKTSLLRREVQNQFTQGIPNTIGIDFKIKMYQIGETAVKGQLWDSIYGSGEKCYGGSHSKHHFYRNAQVVGFCFAIDNKQSFYDLHQLIADVRTCTEARLFLIGCKGDRMPEVPDEEVMDYAEKHQLTYFRTSSLQTWGVNQLFLEMMKQGLPLRLAQLQKQKEQIIDVVPLKPPCKQKCEIM